MTPNGPLIASLRRAAKRSDPSFPQTFEGFASHVGVDPLHLGRVEQGRITVVSGRWLTRVAAGLGVETASLERQP